VAVIAQMELPRMLTEDLAAGHRLDLAVVERDIRANPSHGNDDLLQDLEVVRAAFEQLVANILQDRSRAHNSVAPKDFAGECGQRSQPGAGEHSVRLDAVSVDATKRVHQRPGKDVVCQVREVSAALDNYIGQVLVGLDLRKRNLEDDSGRGIGSLGQ
jgi:DNA-binding FrmR family transcriptional regulator